MISKPVYLRINGTIIVNKNPSASRYESAKSIGARAKKEIVLMYPDLADKVVMITGAAGNMGQAVARYFEDAEARLILADQKCEHILERFGKDAGDKWLIMEGDVTSKDQVDQLVAKAVSHYGHIDVLINIAGGFAGGEIIYETEEKTWDLMMNLNAKSVFLVGGAVAKVMVEKGRGGRIINIGARPGLQGTGYYAAYSASKSAVLRLTESMSNSLQEHNIRVNAILPANIDTPANRAASPDADFNKWVTPESIADVIGFLAADASRPISGALIPVYGG